MISARRFAIPLLTVAALLPQGALAQPPDSPDGWRADDDGHVFIHPGDPGVEVSFQLLDPADAPASLAGQTLSEPLLSFELDPPGSGGVELLKLVDRSTIPAAPEGREPVASVLIADGGLQWLEDQHAFIIPPTCTGEPDDGCLDPDVAQPLLDALAAPAQQQLRGGGYPLNGSMTGDHGVVLAMAGGATIAADVGAKRGKERVTVKGEVTFLDGYGGTLAGFGVDVFDTAGPMGDEAFPAMSNDQLIERLTGTKVKKGRSASRKVQCPASGEGLVASHFHFTGLGSGAAQVLELDGLEGGADLILTHLQPVRCGTPPPSLPLAGLGCSALGVQHDPFEEWVSQLLAEVVFFTVGLPPGTVPGAGLRVGNANNGMPVELEVLEIGFDPGEDVLLPATDPPGSLDQLQAWHASGQLGIDSYGNKPIRSFALDFGEGQSIVLTAQLQDQLGKKFKVDERERTKGTCPDLLELDLEQLAAATDEIFADGFESGDISAWSYSRP